MAKPNYHIDRRINEEHLPRITMPYYDVDRRSNSITKSNPSIKQLTRDKECY